jgi:hypothetical protein
MKGLGLELAYEVTFLLHYLVILIGGYFIRKFFDGLNLRVLTPCYSVKIRFFLIYDIRYLATLFRKLLSNLPP